MNALDVLRCANKTWVVVENAGTDREEPVMFFYKFDVAKSYIQRSYLSRELDALNVDVMRVLPDGTLTTDY